MQRSILENSGSTEVQSIIKTEFPFERESLVCAQMRAAHWPAETSHLTIAHTSLEVIAAPSNRRIRVNEQYFQQTMSTRVTKLKE